MNRGKGRGGVLAEETQANGGRRGGIFFPVVWLRKK